MDSLFELAVIAVVVLVAWAVINVFSYLGSGTLS